METRLPLIPNIHINAFSGGTITELESGITNGVIHQKNGINYLTQRPSMDIAEDASVHISDTKGRGLYYWAENSILYIINDGTLYKASQSTSLSTSPSAGTKRCYFFPIGGKLVMLDPENDEGWTITTGDAVAAIASNFPSTLAAGGAVLNNVLYVLDTAGVVYGSDSGDATVWNALNFLGAARDPDGGVHLGKHHDSLIVLGPASLEVFYDAGNSSGSPLSRRQDVAYTGLGCTSGESVWEIGDRLFWVGVDGAGATGVYTLEQFTPRKISTDTIDSFITQALVKDSYTIMGSGLSAAGHDYYILSVLLTPDSIAVETSLVFDATVGLWYIWDMTVNGGSKFPLAAWTKRDGVSTQYGQGILANGDIVSVNDDLFSQDSLLGAKYVVTDYVAGGYVVDSVGKNANVAMTARTGMFDGGSNRYKYPESLRFVGDKTPNSQTLSIKWADENNVTFGSNRSQDTSINSKEHRLGRFQRRNHEIAYSGTDKTWLEALELVFEVGNN